MRRGGWWALVLWVAVIVGARVVLVDLVYSGAHLRIPFPPLDASLDWRPDWWLLVPVALGALVVARAGDFAARASWRMLVVGSTVVAAAWAVALALLDGAAGLTNSVTLKNEYLLDVGRVGSPLEFLGGFTSHIAEYRIHVQGHPPGYLLLLSLLDRLGLALPSIVATIEIAGGALAVPAVLVTMREVAGEPRARAAWAFVAAAPVAIWVATSADALYAGVGAWAVALVVLATGRTDRRGDVYALAGGLLFGVAAFLSYGLVLLAAIPVAVALQRRRLRPAAVATVGAGVVVVSFALAGFWWLAGLAATRARYHAGGRVAPALRRLPPGQRRVPRDRHGSCDRRGPGSIAGPAHVVARRWRAPRNRCRRGQRDVEGRGGDGSGCRSRSGCSPPAPCSPCADAHRAGWPLQLRLRDRCADPGAQPVVILVTGGAGFIGSFVVEQLCDLGHEVRVLDRLHPGAHDGASRPISIARAEWHWGDCCDIAAAARCSTASMPCVTRRRWSDSASTSATLPATCATTTSVPPCCSRRCTNAISGGASCVASSMVVYGEGRYRCATHGIVRPAPRTRADLEARRWEPHLPRLWACARPRGGRRDRAA